MEIIISPKVKLEKNKLTLDPSLTYEEWRDAGTALKQIEVSSQIWIGDWARFGEKQGFTGKHVKTQVYNELEQATGLERKTLQNYKNIAEATATSRETSPRGEHISFAHYREIASLPEEKQKQLIEKVNAEKLTSRQLREIVKKEKPSKQSEETTEHEANQPRKKEMEQLANRINLNYSTKQKMYLLTLIK